MRAAWALALAALAGACWQVQVAPRAVVARDPAAAARAQAPQIAAGYDAVLDQLAAADRAAAAHDDYRAYTGYRDAGALAVQLHEELTGSAAPPRDPDLVYNTRHDGLLSRAALLDNLVGLRVRAGQAAGEAWRRYVDALAAELHAVTPLQRALLTQRGRPEVTSDGSETCWVYGGGTKETFCWAPSGRLVRDDRGAPAPAPVAPAPPPAPAPAPAAAPAAPAPPPATATSIAIAYYAAATFAAGTCQFGNCMKDGWTTTTPDGAVTSTCDFGDCGKNGWTSQHPDGSTSRTSCNFGDCFKEGWTTEHPDGSTSRTSCSFGDCSKQGWQTELPDGTSSTTSCSFGDCFKDGWTTRLPDGQSVTCQCSFGDCLANGATCN